MRVAVFEKPQVDAVLDRPLPMPRERTLARIALTAIVALAAALRFDNLAALGYANHYYSAAVEAMLQSWHNLFFVAAEPGGSVSVDKPPVGLWLQALSARILGVNTLGVLLPEILAGILSVIVVYYLVRRWFGDLAGLVAALALAVTPVVVATDRNNTIDSMLILTLILATWALIKATETARLRYLLLAVTLVGIGFNIKMLQAYLVLPAFYALYFFGSKEGLLSKVGKLSLATVLLLVVSLSWATIVDLTPPNQRPYVGSSSDNSEMNLILGYNGMERLLGMGGRGGLVTTLLNGLGGSGVSGGRQGFGRGFQPPPSATGGSGLSGLFNLLTGAGGAGAFGGFGGFGGFGETGRPGLLRLIVPPLSKEASWLLPLGLFGALLLVFRARLHWPVALKHQAVILWGGWLVTAGLFFSVAGFFHQYYLSMIAPPVAALAGIAIGELWHLREKHPWWALALLLPPVAATLWLQYNTAAAFIGGMWWMPLLLALLLVGTLLLIPLLRPVFSGAATAGMACVIAALLITPGIWSALTMLNSSANQSLPAAYDGRSSGPPNRGRSTVDQALLAYLEPRTQNDEFMMAVPSSMQGADYVLATGRPVLYLGGFMGQDKVLTAAQLAQLVAEGKLRYIYWDARSGNGFGRGSGSQSDISAWVTNTCQPVQGYDTATENSGAPDGTSGPSFNRGGPVFGRPGMQVTLYDCKG